MGNDGATLMKLELNGKTYNTEDFNGEATEILNLLMFNNQQSKQLEIARNVLLSSLEKAIEDVEPEEEPTVEG
jgi:hypothetical protein